MTYVICWVAFVACGVFFYVFVLYGSRAAFCYSTAAYVYVNHPYSYPIGSGQDLPPPALVNVRLVCTLALVFFCYQYNLMLFFMVGWMAVLLYSGSHVCVLIYTLISVCL